LVPIGRFRKIVHSILIKYNLSSQKKNKIIRLVITGLVDVKSFSQYNISLIILIPGLLSAF